MHDNRCRRSGLLDLLRGVFLFVRHGNVSLEKVGCLRFKHVHVLHLGLLLSDLSRAGLQNVFGSGIVHLLSSKSVSQARHKSQARRDQIHGL